MIPMEWPMLFFVELLFTVYMLLNFIVVAADKEHKNIYSAFDWYNNPGGAIGYLFVCYALLAVIFAIFWAFTHKVKL